MDQIKAEIREYSTPIYFRTGFMTGKLFTHALWISEHNENDAFLVTIEQLKKLPTYSWCEEAKCGGEAFTSAPKTQTYTVLWSGHIVEKKYNMLIIGFSNYFVSEWL